MPIYHPMRQRTLAVIGIAVTALLMSILVYSVTIYLDDPGNGAAMVLMGALSMALMTFLVIFGIIYVRPRSDSARYQEMYMGTCSVCGGRFSDDGVCEGCGRLRQNTRK